MNTTLPEEILLKIINYVTSNPGDLSTLSLVNHQWYRLCLDNSLWNKLYFKYFGSFQVSFNAKNQFRRMLNIWKKNNGKLYNINFNGSNALHIASQQRWNCIELIDTLISHGMKLKETNLGGLTPLHTAIEIGNEDAVSHILSIDNSIVNMSDYQGRTPLHFAAKNGSYSICIKLLQASASPVSVDSQNQTPLHYAAKAGKVDVCRLLAPMYGRHFIELPDINGNTALLLAASTNKENCMRVLIEEFYANCSASDRSGRTVMDSVTRLMNDATIKWTKEHEIWDTRATSQCKIYDVPSEHEEWDRIALQQKKQFSAAYNNLLVHYH